MNRRETTPAGCRPCHYDNEPTPQGLDLAGLNLTTLGSLRRGGYSTGTNIVIPGDPDGSLLVQKLEGRYTRGVRMPKDLAAWTPEEIALVRRWILEGAQGADSE